MGLRDYGVIVLRDHWVEALHVLELIWAWGYRYIEFSDVLKYFLRLERNADVLVSNGLRITDLVSEGKNTFEYHSGILHAKINCHKTS